MECFECGAVERLHEHHVVPQSLGGKKTVTLCAACHGKAHDARGMREGLRRASDTKARQRERGEYAGGEIPYGQEKGRNGLLRPCAEEQAIIRQIKELRAFGLSLRQIGVMLVARGLEIRGRKTWHPQTVSKILEKDA